MRLQWAAAAAGDSSLVGAALRLLPVIAEAANSATGEFWTSLTTLGRRCAMSERSARVGVRDLRERGWLALVYPPWTTSPPHPTPTYGLVMRQGQPRQEPADLPRQDSAGGEAREPVGQPGRNQPVPPAESGRTPGRNLPTNREEPGTNREEGAAAPAPSPMRKPIASPPPPPSNAREQPPAAATAARRRISSHDPEAVRRGLEADDLGAILRAFACDLTGPRLGEWRRDAGGLQLGELVVILAWRDEVGDRPRNASGLRHAREQWAAMPVPERREIAGRFTERYGMPSAKPPTPAPSPDASEWGEAAWAAAVGDLDQVDEA